MMKTRAVLALTLLLPTMAAAIDLPLDLARLADEVRGKGWIVFPARSEEGDWDLFLMRPDGSQRRALTRTPEWNESAPQFSRDGTRLLYRRLKRGETIDGNRYGEQGALVVANSDGTGERVLGAEGELPWASWSPDGQEIATLSVKGVAFVDLASRQVRRTLPRRGLYQQLTWSPDGKWLCGVANSFGTGWSVARMNVATGEASAISRVDCCTPDWFPDSKGVVFSWRPSGQKGNDGQGWTQLWMADAKGKTRQLVYGEDGRHVYGGHVSPDGRYILFTGNLREDGDPENAGAPMGLMRLSDAPIIGGESEELRALHPEAKAGPVLILPAGWEPSWTPAEIIPSSRAGGQGGAEPASEIHKVPGPASTAANPDEKLRAELNGAGWLAFSAPNERGDWDLFAMRPDGAERTRLTDTPDTHEIGPRFSPDGKHLLYYRAPRSTVVGNNTYGTFELVIAAANGSALRSLGEGHGWASWSPDGTRLAYLARDGIHFLDAATGRDLGGKIPRHGLVQQLVWSPDGRAFAGTANGLGPFWNIGVLSADGGTPIAVSETERYNCTPDWTPDSAWVLYARGIIGGQTGYAQLWRARRDGSERQVLYAEEGTHICGGCASPDGKFLIFTRSASDLGDNENKKITMSILRLADAPLNLKAEATNVPRLDLGPGWEPHWTHHQLPTTGRAGGGAGE
ncbi:MAG: hypothetical protein L0Z50_18750 [Verrucomicrobiales bacterium]|nr:hypothetical protein [Verrucomicrobiales bacterium]